MIYGILISLLILLLIIISISNFAYRQVFLAKRKTEESAFQAMEDRKIYNRLDYNSLDLIDEEILSEDNILLKGYHLKSTINNNKVILLIHGYTGNHFMSLQFVDLYKELGFDIFMIDARSHGSSGGNYPTYGIKEKEDIKSWINFIRNKYDNDITIGLHGQSMGAATALLYGKKYGDVDFIIADCPFSDAKKVLCYQFENVARVPGLPMYHLLNSYVKLFCGLNLNDSNPIENISELKISTLFIHGNSDTIIPSIMSEELYNAKSNNSHDKLLIIKGAEHVEAFKEDKHLYTETVKDFILKMQV